MQESIGALLLAAVDAHGPRIAMRRRREALQWSVLSWAETGEMSRSIAAGMLSLGVGVGDRVALLARTRIEWSLVDYATLSIGAVLVPLYHSNTPSQWAFVIRDSGASVVVVEDREQLDALVPLLGGLPAVRHIVVMDPADLREVPLAQLLDELAREGRRHLREREGDLESVGAGIGRGHLATLVYTSGTTGEAKGVQLTHGNLLAAVESLQAVLDVGPDDTTVLCLPLSHIYPRLAQFAALATGFCIAYAQRVDRLGEVLQEVRPTFFFAVPRIYERIHQETVARYRELPPLLQTAFRKGVAATRERRGLPGPVVDGAVEAASGPKWSVANKVAERLADKAIFEPVREALGGRVRFCVSGGAPMNMEVLRFFQLAGIEVLEGYGLTESVGAGTINPPGEARLGTVGRPLPGVRVRVAADGEILLRGAAIFSGYHGLPEETSMALDDDGWLHTGDLGEFDEAGYLRITDRKKDLIITSGAKNVPPQMVEGGLRLSAYISEAMVFGDRRPYLVALLTLNEEELRRFAGRVGLKAADWTALLREPRVLQLIGEEVERCNEKLAKFERVRRFRILPRSLSVEGGELTPTFKVRREAVFERHRPLIEAMYQELPPA